MNKPTTVREGKPRNSQIKNWQLVKHSEGHKDQPYELIWAFRGADRTEVTWRFFKTQKASLAFASDLENAVLNANGSAKETL